MEFVCRSPSDYYKVNNSPYLTSRYEFKTDHGFIWTSIGPIIFDREHDNEDELNSFIQT